MNDLKTISDFENAINKIKIKNKTIIDIVYSITFHEHPICMLDLLLNILVYNHMNSILIICSINENMYLAIKNIKFPPNIKINPIVRPTNARMLWNTNLFAAHMNNLEYIKNANIHFTYFCTLASNEMFIKNVDINIIKDKIVLKKKEFKKTDPIKILDKLNSWVHYKPFMKNFNICSFFIKNGYEPFALQHEGLILPQTIMYDILKLYKKDNFNNKTINIQDVLLEEVFISTYLHNNYDYNDYVLTYRNYDNYSVSHEEMKGTDLYSVKRVPRDINNDIRCFIRDNCIAYLASLS